MPSLKPAESTHLRRIVLMAVLCIVPFALILGRYYYLQIIKYDFYAAKAAFHARPRNATKVTQMRGGIYSSMGTPLATSEYRDSVYICPTAFKDDNKKRR